MLHIYGAGRIQPTSPLNTFIVLTWSHRNTSPCRIEQVAIDDDPRLPDDTCRAAEPFYHDESCHFMSGYVPHDRDAYRAILKRVSIVRIDGGVDFDAATRRALDIIGVTPR